jgi:putative ATPase
VTNGAGLVVEVKEERFNSQLHISSTLIERWFGMIGDRTTYAMYLSRLLSPPEIDAVKSLFNRYLLNQTVSWSSAIAFVHAASPKHS